MIASDCEITNEQSRLFHEAIGFSEVNRREGSLMKQFEVEDGTRVTMHGQELVFGETIFAARSSNDILEAPDALSQRLDEDGYLVIRGFHNPGRRSYPGSVCTAWHSRLPLSATQVKSVIYQSLVLVWGREGLRNV